MLPDRVAIQKRSVIMGILTDIGIALLDLALPPRCHICKESVPDSRSINICPGCMEKLPFLSSPFCTVCGIPFAGSGEDHICGPCISSPPPYKAARAAMQYIDSCRDMIHAFKYQEKTSLRRPLGLLTARCLEDFANSCNADCIIPVPLHVSRLRKRGFNQSILIGEILAGEWRLPLLRQGLKRTVATRPQIELSKEERMLNLKKAFTVPKPLAVKDKRILLVDDVFTTGSTISESASTLLEAGASAVFAVTVAHAP